MISPQICSTSLNRHPPRRSLPPTILKMVNVSKVSSKQPKSNTCQQPLDAATDRNKYGGRYFKNCVACRSVATSRKKQLRQQRQEAIAQGTSAAGAADPVPTEQACASCRENVPVDRLVRLKACQHNPQTCEDCFAGWVECTNPKPELGSDKMSSRLQRHRLSRRCQGTRTC